jgi:hypothetical protein
MIIPLAQVKSVHLFKLTGAFEALHFYSQRIESVLVGHDIFGVGDNIDFFLFFLRVRVGLRIDMLEMIGFMGVRGRMPFPDHWLTSFDDID